MVAGHGGFSKYHWYGMLVPLAAALSPMLLSRLRIPKVPQPIVSIMAGFVVAVAAYAIFQYLPPFAESHALGRAVLLGALVTEVLIFHGTSKLPPMTNITLFLFLYFFSAEFLASKTAGEH